jgi:flagellar hook-length control protein FliK
MSKSGASNTARIMLTPRTLGDITLRISMVGNSVKLHIKADKSETAEHIDRQLPLLKERLNDNGLKVEQVIIDSAESENLTYFNQNQDKNEQKELRRQFIDSFRNLAAKEDFELSLDNVAYYNIDSPIMSYNKVGSKVNV